MTDNKNARTRRAMNEYQRASKLNDFVGFKDGNMGNDPGAANISVTSDISDRSPMKGSKLFKPSTHVNASKRVLMRKGSMNDRAGNPLLKNTRYPNMSDAQTGRWKSETMRSFVKYKKK